MNGPLLTPLHSPYWHPENITCWMDYLGLVNDLLIVGLAFGMIYLLAAEKVKKWRNK
jgi:hypothetical protein